MNSRILDKYDVKFYRNSKGEKLIECKNVISSYLYIWRFTEDIDEFLADVKLALEGNIKLVEDTDYSEALLKLFGEITPEYLIISDETNTHRIRIPLSDFEELLKSWKEYLESNEEQSE